MNAWLTDREFSTKKTKYDKFPNEKRLYMIRIIGESKQNIAIEQRQFCILEWHSIGLGYNILHEIHGCKIQNLLENPNYVGFRPQNCE